MAAFLADLDRYEVGQRPVAPPLTRARRAKLWARLHRRRLGTAALVALVVAAAFAGGAAYWRAPTPPPPRDPREVIREELLAGNEVTLVGDRGEPRWSAWRLGGGTFGKAAGGGIMFETIDVGMLELLDDPGISSYTIRAQIQQVRSMATAGLPDRRRDEDHIGVYFGHADLSAAKPPTHAFFAVWFADYDPAAGPLGPVKDQPVSMVRVLRTVAPKGEPYQHPTAFAQRLFTPVVRRPGLLRSIEINVTPEEISARWLAPDGQWRPLRGSPPIVPKDKFALLQADLDAIRPQAGVEVPPWSPRTPLGIYARGSAIEVHNVTVIPR